MPYVKISGCFSEHNTIQPHHRARDANFLSAIDIEASETFSTVRYQCADLNLIYQNGATIAGYANRPPWRQSDYADSESL